MMYPGNKHLRSYSYRQCRLPDYIQRPVSEAVVSRFPESLRHYDKNGPRHGQQLHWI
jgi:hypothetical protein